MRIVFCFLFVQFVRFVVKTLLHFVVLLFDFFTGREESLKEKNPGPYASRLALSVFFVCFVCFVVQILLAIGLRAKPTPRGFAFSTTEHW